MQTRAAKRWGLSRPVPQDREISGPYLALLGVIAAALWPLGSWVHSDASEPPPVRPPGCAELGPPTQDGRRPRLRPGRSAARARGDLPLNDPLFGVLCDAEVVGGTDARGACYRVRGRVVCLPSFLVVGFTKAGTSVFFQYATQHKLVRGSRLKEPAYLGSDVEVDWDAEEAAVWRNDSGGGGGDGGGGEGGEGGGGGGGGEEGRSEGRALRPYAAEAKGKSLRWYTSLFPACTRCERGEATPGYAWRDFSAVAAAQAARLLGSVRLIMLVREPIARAASHYRYMQSKRGRFRRVANLSQALRSGLYEFERCVSQLGGEWRHQCTYRQGRREVEAAAGAIARVRPEMWRLRHGKNSYELVQAGLYSEHMATWRDHFELRSLLVLDSAELLSRPTRVMRRFEKHLGLPFGRYTLSSEHVLGDGRGADTAAARPAGASGGALRPGVAADAAISQLDAALRRRLERFFTPFNRRLRRVSGVGWTYP